MESSRRVSDVWQGLLDLVERPERASVRTEEERLTVTSTSSLPGLNSDEKLNMQMTVRKIHRV